MSVELVVMVELIRTEPGQHDGGGWTAHVSTCGLGDSDTEGELEWQPHLAQLLAEARRVIDGLRASLGPLRVEYRLNGSERAARAATRAEGLRLPR